MRLLPKHPILIAICLIFLIGGLTYLPNIGQVTYFRDDWYYMMDGASAGARVFHEMFSIDRPARGYLFEVLFNLFGTQPLPYHLTSFLWRILGGMGALWLFNLLWPNKHWQATLMAVLFCVYPGYLWWVAGVEYQPMVLSVGLHVFSIAMTIQALRETHLPQKLIWLAGAIISGWAALLLVEYAIGMEVFRWLCIGLVLRQNAAETSKRKLIGKVVRAWAISLAIPIGFLAWRLFIFNNVRSDTDVQAQLSGLWHAPLATSLTWALKLIQSTLTVSLRAWLVPFYDTFLSLEAQKIGLGVALATAAVIFTLLAASWIKPQKLALPGGKADQWALETAVMGILGVMFGLLPVIMANRTVDFERFSHYALPASLAGVVFVVGMVNLAQNHRIQKALAAILVFVAVATGYANSTAAAHEEMVIRQFWQQMVWRAPNIRPGTTLLIYYPLPNNIDVTDSMWGAANLIYYPQTNDQIPVQYTLGADAVTRFVMQDVLIRAQDRDGTYRTHTIPVSYQNTLIITQPSLSSCIHILDHRWPRGSAADNANILVMERYGATNAILPDGNPVMPAIPFGTESIKTWCYYYEKAELALQEEDWRTAYDMFTEGLGQGFSPSDGIEWLTLAQSALVLGDEAGLTAAAEGVESDLFARWQACTAIHRMEEEGLSIDAVNLTLSEQLFCQP